MNPYYEGPPFGPNRITKYVATVQAQLDALGGVGKTGRPLAELEAELDITCSEFVAFQNAQARAHVEGKLTSGEAATVYRLLGGEAYHEGSGWPEGTTLAQKVTVTNLMGELISEL